MSSGRMRVLITGASGFIGANLARAEIAAGNETHLLLRREAKLWRLAHLEGSYTPQWGDLRDAAAVRAAVEASRPDIVYHLATHGAYHFQKERAAILATNLTGTANVLDALVGREYRALVYTGSSSEYGHKDRPMREDDRVEPRTDYGVSKAASTLLCQAESYRGAPVALVRVFSAYGPWEEPSRLVPYVLDCCMRGQVPKTTAGSQPRDFIHVDDVVTLLCLAARTSTCHGHILHAGTGVQRTVADMVASIARVCATGITPALGAEVERPDEPKCWVASIEQTTRLTGWKPRHDLTTGIQQMKDWWLGRQGRMAA